MVRAVGYATVSLVALMALMGCGGDPEHPPGISNPGVGGSDGGGSGGVGGGGNSGGVAGCEPDPQSGTKVSGDLIIYESFGMMDPVGYAGLADIAIEGTPCGFATTTYDGSGAVDGGAAGSDGGPTLFELYGVKPVDEAWIHFYQQQGGAQDVTPTLIKAGDTTSNLHALGAFGFLRESEVQKVYDAVSVSRDPGKATIVVLVQDLQSGKPYSGAVVSTPSGPQVAYGGGSTWALGGLTDPAGLAVLLNLDGEEFPGASVNVKVEVSGAPPEALAPVEIGATTFLWIGVGFGP